MSSSSNASLKVEKEDKEEEIDLTSKESPKSNKKKFDEDVKMIFEETTDSYVFKSKLRPISDEIDRALSRDVHLKVAEYTKHEFLKMSEVSSMINEAV